MSDDSTGSKALDARFEQAGRDARTLPERPDNDTLLQLYALYKQGRVGDLNTGRPGFFDVVGSAKHEAWLRLSGTPADEARRRYVALVEQLKAAGSQD